MPQTPCNPRGCALNASNNYEYTGRIAGNQCSQVAMWVLITSHRGQQHIERVGVIMSYPVDEEGRGAAYSAMPPAFDILTQPRRKNMVLQLPLEALGIKSEVGSVVQQVLIVERILMLEKHLVHLPELALRSGSFRCFRSMPGMRMHLRHGKMAKDEA